ncbi:lysylphosphatidylglycerol synthase transmembrane domain-containing protein [Thermococcus sp. ES12]|uniref:lysylphosphatidylglycerol synthase transmembrane domain-containing protein n=1 Tax=Thermococcus sp. ES12 TaxID=1638246 RepID=UPI0014322702|nr:lysylphosphatidylglycerol synthase transmembrane domain-containing protein [Thermococcus sp. ES12]NJE76643.1 flippase-like domain-containing protein [Thermococcus sp. ES12]
MDWKKGVFFIGALIVIGALINWAGAQGIAEILRDSDIEYFILAILVYILTLVAWALRWKVLLRGLGIRAPFRAVFSAIFVGMFFNNISPGAKGLGEFIRVYYLAKRVKSPYGPMTASVMMDRILDLVPIAVMMVIATIHVYRLGEIGLTILIIVLDAVLMAFSALVIWLLMSETKAPGAVWWIYRLYHRISAGRAEKRKDSFQNIADVTIPRLQSDFKNLSKDKIATIVALFHSFVYWGLTILRYYFVFLAIKYPIVPMDITVVLVVSMVVGMFAIVPGGAGIIEAVNSAVFVALGINPEHAVTGVLLERLISYWGPTVIGSLVTAESETEVPKEGLPLAAPDEETLKKEIKDKEENEL